MERNDFGLKPWDLTGDQIEPPKELTPYQKLFMAILMDAIETLKKGPRSDLPRYIGQRHYKTREVRLHPVSDALEWLMSDDDDVMGFVSICEYFNWSPNLIRQKALEAIQKAREQGGCRRNRVATDGKRRRKWA